MPPSFSSSEWGLFARTLNSRTLLPWSSVILGPAFGRTDFSRIFIFEPPDFFADFLAGFFLLIFVGKSAQKNPPGKSPGKSSKIYTTKILQHNISADCPGQVIQGNFYIERFSNIGFQVWGPLARTDFGRHFAAFPEMLCNTWTTEARATKKRLGLSAGH